MVVAPDAATTRTDFRSSDPPTARATNVPPPATTSLTVTVPLRVSALPGEAILNAPPRLTSCTKTVPASVPSDFHSS